MSLRPASWLAPLAIVALLGAGAATAMHGRLASAPTSSVHSSVRDATTYVAGADGIITTSSLRVRPTYTPPPSPSPSTPPAGSAPAPAARPAPAIAIGSYQQVLINRDRAAHGLPPLTWSSCLASVAVSNAVRLSRQGWVQPYHTNGPTLDLGCRLGNQAGENVGYWSGGINDAQLNTMFMNSPEHRANILGPYRHVATAWAVAPNGAAYIAVEFS